LGPPALTLSALSSSILLLPPSNPCIGCAQERLQRSSLTLTLHADHTTTTWLVALKSLLSRQTSPGTTMPTAAVCKQIGMPCPHLLSHLLSLALTSSHFLSHSITSLSLAFSLLRFFTSVEESKYAPELVSLKPVLKPTDCPVLVTSVWHLKHARSGPCNNDITTQHPSSM
jgi:hypothetical protein